MSNSFLDVKRVAIVGAGVSGVSAAVHLSRAGVDVTVYERSARAGGIWVYDEQSARDAAYPSTVPSMGDSPEYRPPALKRGIRHDSPLNHSEDTGAYGAANQQDGIALSFAPPGPCYIALQNNVSTVEMKLSCLEWKANTAEFVPHHVLADYIQDVASANGVADRISFNSRIDSIEKCGKEWKLHVSYLVNGKAGPESRDSIEFFDAVVVACGHYHACNIPDIPGLSEWKKRFPSRVRHSKLYRRPDEFKDQNVLIIGAGVSSTDIARDIGQVGRLIYQSSRGGPYDLPSWLLPDNAARVGGVASFDAVESAELTSEGTIPATVTLTSGEKLCTIHQVIVSTGYHVSLPFMRQYHADGISPEDADEHVLSTNGQVTHNLHKDIWYIPDPTLAFVGVPYHVATFSLFEFQAMALAATFAGKVPLPSRPSMREEYLERVKQKGAGRTFHSLKDAGAEPAYVLDLVKMVHAAGGDAKTLMTGHSHVWLEAYDRRRSRQKELFSKIRDSSFDMQVMQLSGC